MTFAWSTNSFKRIAWRTNKIIILYYYNKLRQNIGKIKTLDKKRTDMSFKKIVRDLNPWPGVLTKYIARRANHYATELYSFS